MSLDDNLGLEGEFQMENEMVQDEFTFKKVWDLLKASVVRGVVFCLIAAIVMGIVSAIVLTTTKKSREMVTAIITYAHTGVENGKAPDGTSLNVNRIKSPQIVKRAIEVYNLTAKEADKIDDNELSRIIENIDITGHLPQNIIDLIEFQMSLGEKADATVLKELYNVFPSQYSITIQNFRELGFTEKQTTVLIDEILDQYIADFKEVYGNPTLLDNMVAPSVSHDDVFGFEFIELYTVYEENIKKAISYLQEHSKQNPLFRSQATGKTFNEIANELVLMQSTKLFQLETFILLNSVANDLDYTLEYFLATRRQYVQYEKAASENATEVLDLIGKYENGDIIITAGPNGEPITATGGPTAMYDSLFSLYNTYVSRAINYATLIETLDQRLEYFAEEVGGVWQVRTDLIGNDNSEAVEKAEVMSIAFAEQINVLFDIANDTAADYYENEYMKNAINKTLNASYIEQSTSLFRLMFIISFAVVFLAGLAAIITTHTVLARKKIEANKTELKTETN